MQFLMLGFMFEKSCLPEGKINKKIEKKHTPSRPDWSGEEGAGIKPRENDSSCRLPSL